ncbi:MAG: hypothetical protein HY403_01780 [Elusimicrobia bacterium]|nr:hypothetical protein [Elusimicrobiota bacterium]
MGEMAVMGRGGDARISWDKSKPDEVEAARKVFDDLRGKGYLGFTVTMDGDKGEQVTEFDQDAEKIILAPPIRGG